MNCHAMYVVTLTTLDSRSGRRSLILGFLHPIDLFHLMRATRESNAMPRGPEAESIWRTSFSHHPDMPCSPPGCTPQSWACIPFDYRAKRTVSLVFPPATNQTILSPIMVSIDLVHLHATASILWLVVILHNGPPATVLGTQGGLGTDLKEVMAMSGKKPSTFERVMWMT